MPNVTIQLLEGLERGRVYANLAAPVSIGREEENQIRLNDERVSRYHAKIQLDGDRLILTDLDSTNGTRVNGHPIQLHVLNIGDQILIGRCLMIFGSRDEVETHAKKLLGMRADNDDFTVAGQTLTGSLPNLDRTHKQNVPPAESWSLPQLFPHGAPKVPAGLAAGQRAELCDLLAYVHDRIRVVLETGDASRGERKLDRPVMEVNWLTWQSLLALEMDLATYLRQVAEPDA